MHAADCPDITNRLDYYPTAPLASIDTTIHTVTIHRCAIDNGYGTTPGALWIAVIDWGFDSSIAPTVITGPTPAAINAAAALRTTDEATTDTDTADFLASRALDTTSTRAIDDWLNQLRETLTAPRLTTYQVHPNGFSHVHQADPAR